MNSDPFRDYYRKQLDGSYDCVDRIVLTAYNPFIQRGGGFRTWWRLLNGSDDKLDDTHLMRFAGHFARSVKAFSEKNHIPLIDCTKIERKDEEFEKYLPQQTGFRGLFCIFFNRAPACVFKVNHFGKGGIDITRKEPWPYVNMYAFHIIDEEWGHIIIRFCPHPPFNAMIILNGHEYVEREARKCGIRFSKEDNCFTSISNAAALSRIADSMTSSNGGVGRLAGVCERWIYSTCLCFALQLAEQEKTQFRYAYSVFQAEYSVNLLFKQGTVLDKVFNGIIDRTRSALDIRSVKTIFGRQRRPRRRKQHGKQPRFEVVVEKPAYNLTVFKVHFGRLTVKMYSKGEHVLRIEAIVHNTADLRTGRSLAKFPAIICRLAHIANNFLAKLRCVDVPFIDAQAIEQWHRKGAVNGHATAGIDINNPRLRVVMEALISLSISPHPMCATTLAEKVREIAGMKLPAYTARQAAYDLRKFRGKGIVDKKDRSRSYCVTNEGLRAMVAFIVIRDKVIIPVLSCAGDLRKIRNAETYSEVELHTHAIQREMKKIFIHYHLAA